MPIRSVGLLQARVPICLSGRSCKAATPRSTPSRNSFIADGSCNCSPVLITIADDCLPRNQIPNHEIAFNIHNPQPGSPRPRRLRLPSRLQIESASPTHHPQQSSSLREALPILASDNSGVNAHIDNNAYPIKQFFGWILIESAASGQPPPEASSSPMPPYRQA
jgi:hypothetical protein